MLRSLVAGLATLVLVAVAPAGAAEPFTFDKSHTQVYFEVDHFGFSTTRGLFREMDGTLVLDRTTPANSKVELTIKTASVDTQWGLRDEHLRSKDFLDTAAHPTMTFTSTRVIPTGEGTAKVEGQLTLLGVTQPVVLDVRLNKLAPSPITNKLTAGFTAETVVKRTLWGMQTYAPAIGDEVRVRIDAEAFLPS